MKFILGRKLGMSTIYSKEKGALNVTLVECGPNVITQVRNTEKDGYEAVQIGIANPKRKTQSEKSRKDYLKIKEFKGELKDKKTGDKIDISQFEVGDKVKVSGITKGKGFQGMIKRYGIKLERTKAEKGRRHRATMGPITPAKVGWWIAQSGQVGSHQRTEYNRQILLIANGKEKRAS